MNAEWNQRTVRTIPFLIALGLASLPADAKYGGGAGEPNDPFLIYTAEQMNEIGLHEGDWDKHFALADDVNLADYTKEQFHMIGNYGTIARCYSSAMVTGSQADLGGLVGTNSAWITNCYSTGWARGGRRAGGLVGSNIEYGTVTNCYCCGGASGYADVGGLAGVDRGRNTGSFWDTETSGLRTSAGGTGKTAAEMQTASTYLNAGWDLVGETVSGTEDIWWIDEGKDYPRLWWEGAEE